MSRRDGKWWSDNQRKEQVVEKPPMFTYHCAQCGERCSSNHKEIKIERYIADEMQTKRCEGMGLGTWNCEKHGKVKVTRRVNIG